ncbi:hypothetical protein MKW92_027706 [Papaver armeniacum]|nr:hypothetical protein MKW92_027706 [Papaver armeniacum]
MSKRKIEIKYIENTTNRRVTYSKRKKGILKKANELSFLCDAQVCLIMFSKTGKLAEYISPSTTMKDFFDRYEKNTNLSPSSEYEAGNENLLKTLENELRKQKEINSTLRKEIGHRTGQEDLSEFSYSQLLVLKGDLRHSLEIVRHDKIRFKEAPKHRLKERGRGLNALNAVPSQQLLPSQPNLYDAATSRRRILQF